MIKLLVLLISSLCYTRAGYVSKMTAEMLVTDCNLERNQHLNLKNLKKISKGNVEHLTLRNCSGVIDSMTFKGFPKLNRLTIWKSNIEEINSPLLVNQLVVMGSHFPDLNEDLQQKLPKLRSLLVLGNKNFSVDPNTFKKLKNLATLRISEAHFNEDCITKEWFKELTSLRELGLDDNDIKCVTDDAFNSLKNLLILDLSYNKINSLDKKVFKQLSKLERLGLYENHIKTIDINMLANQRSHLEGLGISWSVLKNSQILAEDLLRVLPKLKWISFGREEMPNDFAAGVFCQKLRQNDVKCMVDQVFGVGRNLGFLLVKK